MRLSLLACALVMNFLINLGSDRTAIAQQAKRSSNGRSIPTATKSIGPERTT